MTSESLMSASERIRQLSAINADVAAMMQSAGQAVNTLTDRPLNQSVNDTLDVHMIDGGGDASLDDRKQEFAQHTKAYYHSLQAIVARLRRQAYALEEAGIIAAEASTGPGAMQSRQSGQSPGGFGNQSSANAAVERITNGGLGKLDVGWLNSRGNKVGAEKEGELVGEAKKLLEDTLANHAATDGR